MLKSLKDFKVAFITPAECNFMTASRPGWWSCHCYSDPTSSTSPLIQIKRFNITELESDHCSPQSLKFRGLTMKIAGKPGPVSWTKTSKCPAAV